VDSGTTLAYLVDEAYDPFVSSVSLLFFLFFFPEIVWLNRQDGLVKLKHNWCPVSK
jgi:hypothetical protein